MTRNANRFTTEDRSAIAARIAAELAAVKHRPVTIADDFNRANRDAPRAIGCTLLDLRQSECREVAEMVLAAIAERAAP